MGSFLFGKPAKSKSTGTSSSGNNAYGAISSAMSPTLGYTAAGGDMLGQLLGISPRAAPAPAPTMADNAINIGNTPIPNGSAPPKQGAMKSLASSAAQPQYGAAQDMQQGAPEPVAPPSNQASALEQFSNSTGMDFMREQGIKALEGSQAGRGMLQSGETGTKLVDFGQKLGQTYLNQYIDRLLDYSKLGLGGANAMSGAGGWSTGTNSGTSKGAKEGALPQMVSAVASGVAMSDIRVKKNLVQVGMTTDGIPVYEFDYVEGYGPEGRQLGVMAHEVREIKPEAFVPNLKNGYHGVNYSKIGKLV